MDRIHALNSTLRPAEKKFLRIFLTAFNSREENKALELLEMIESDKHLSAEAAAEKLYGEPKSKAFIMLKSRLYEKMLESLMLSGNPSNTEKELGKEPGFEKIELRKLHLFNIILKRKGLIHLAEELCLKGLKLSREYEYPDLELDFLGTLRVYYATNQSDQYEVIVREMDDAFRRYELEMITSNNWNYYRKQFANKTTVEGAQRYLETAIPQFEESVNRLGTSLARYYLFLMKINYLNFTHRHEECREQIMDLLKLVKKSKRLNNLQGVGVAYTHLAMLEMTTYNLKEALAAVEQAVKFNKKNTHNYMICQLTRVFILLHMGKLEAAEKLIHELESDITYEIYSFNWAVSNYIQSCIAFIRQDYSACWKFLQEVSGLNFDKGGWMTGIRIFEIMVLIERQDFDHATLRLDALRKHLQKHNTDDRANLIYRMLSSLEKQSFHFSSPIKREEEMIEELQHKLPWVIAGHETIRFEYWYRFKRGYPGAKREDAYLAEHMPGA